MAIQATPYEVVFGQSLPIHLSYDLPRESKAQIVAKCVKDREDMLFILNFYLLMAHHIMKQIAHRRRSERYFEIEDWVFLFLFFSEIAALQISISGQ